MPLVSVVMPVYNGEMYLAESIESILSQTLNNLELVVVDDCSSDDSAAIVRNYAKSDERVRLIQQARNLGAASARNSGIAASSGEFIAAMDSDDMCLPQRLDRQADFLRTHPDIGVVGTGIKSVYEDMTARVKGDVPQQHAFIVLRWCLRLFAVGGATIMARRNTLISIGGYEDNRRFADDQELFSRLLWKTRFANLPDPLYIYRRHTAQNTARPRQEHQTNGPEVLQCWLNRLVGEKPPIFIDSLKPLRDGSKIGWRERRQLRRDAERLINALVAAKMLVASDMPLIEAEMNKRLESTMPRFWQMLLHWKRHHFGR